MRIAVLREAGGLGDVICTEPVVRGLREKFPAAEIWYACLPEYLPLVAGWPVKPDLYLTVEVHRRRGRDADPASPRWPYLFAFKDFDLVIDLFCPAFKYEKKMRDRTDKSRVRLFCEAAGVPASCPQQRVAAAQQHWAGGWLSAQGYDPEKRLVGLQPLACGRRRNWPKVKFAELARRLLARGMQVVVFHSFPGPVGMLPGMKATGLPLPETAALAARCDLMVTPDSGFLHLAAALSIPGLSLWGSTNPEVTCEFYPRAQFLWPRQSPARPFACRAPCYSMPGCVSPDCRSGCRILEQLSVDEAEFRVLEALRTSVAGRRQTEKFQPEHRLFSRGRVTCQGREFLRGD